jgi:hypothetical protein
LSTLSDFRAAPSAAKLYYIVCGLRSLGIGVNLGRRVLIVRIRKIRIKGLFGRFNYEIPLNLDDRITIIHGPNGFGKTAVLRLIAALFGNGNATLGSVPFGELEIDFDDKETLLVLQVKPSGSRPVKNVKYGLRFVHKNHSKSHEFLTPGPKGDDTDFPLNLIDQIIPELDREGVDVWRNLDTGELLVMDEVFDRYRDQLNSARPDPPTHPPDWLKALRQAVPIRFIEAERLQTRPHQRRNRPTRPSPSRAVKLYSEELGVVIKRTLTEYAALSQSLDRTFPVRVITHGPTLSFGELQRAFKEIETKRARLVEAGLLEREGQDTTVQVLESVDESNMPVLSVYAMDTNKKLSVFDPLVAKVELFKRSVNERFLYKRLSIGQDGFTITSAEGDRLDPLSLSSGEQHEIVLLYQLLFQAEENSLILIDEPEISLHVAWQEQFLPGLQAITALSNFDALVATHSPQVIGDRWDLTIELKGPLQDATSQTLPVSK